MGYELRKKYVREYFLKLTGDFVLWALLLVAATYMQYFASGALDSPDARKRAIIFPFHAVAVVIIVCRQFKKSFKLFLDLLTGCKTEIVTVTIGRVDEAEFDSVKDHRRYVRYDVTYENGKKSKLMLDKKYCDYRIVKGNIHVVEITRYSHFLIRAQVGKKGFDDKTKTD